MRAEKAFWDASALVPLCVREVASQFVEQQMRRRSPVVWWGTSVEVCSAICRLHRIQKITEKQQQGALARLELLGKGWEEILPNDDLRTLAIPLLGKYSLNAADSWQLAAALVWCGGRPGKRLFLCGDRRLSEAAKAEGFAVIEVSP